MDNSLINTFSLLSCIKDDDIDNLGEITASCFQQHEIYLSTNKGSIYKFDNQVLDEEENTFVISLLGSMQIIPNQAIQQICACTLLDLMVVLINESLSFINISSFTIHSMNMRIKGVRAVGVTESVSENEECVTEMCLGLVNKRLQLYLVEVDRLTLLKEVNVGVIPVTLCLHYEVCCFASSSSYIMVNFTNDNVTELFHYDSTRLRPKIASLPNCKGEFLVKGPDGLGIFADVDGASQKPPIQWSSLIRDFLVLKSVIVAIDNEFVTVHSFNGQKQIQTIHLPNVYATLAGFVNELIIITNPKSSEVNLVQLVPLSWSQQAQQYLDHDSTNKAISIANKQMTRANIDTLSKQKCNKIFVIAGFHKFRKRNFKDAKLLFEKGKIDFRELIFCYPSLLPKSYKFEPKISSHDSGFHILTLYGDSDADLAIQREYKQFLLEFLVEHRGSRLAVAILQIVETALVKLYVELEPDKLFHNFTMMLTDVDFDDLVDYLSSEGHHHACAMVMQWYGQIEDAVNIWSRLVKGEINDIQFPGMEFLKEILLNVSDPKIIVKNIDWLLTFDSISTSNILIHFIERFKEEKDLINILISDDFLQKLADYSDTLFDVLFELCQHKLLENHAQNEYLCQMFITKLFQLKDDKVSFEKTRSQFCKFLTISDEYPAKKLLTQVRDFPVPLLMEEALLLGQISEYSEALEIIVNKLHDFQAAEKYCYIFERKCTKGNLFLDLLKVYLNNCRSCDNDTYKEATLHLIESHTSYLDLNEVLALIPSDWPLNRLKGFLLKCFVLKQQTCFTAKMKYGLEKAINIHKVRETRATIQNKKLVLEEWKELQCGHCGNVIDNCSFIKTSHGQMLHKHCFNCV